MWFDFEAVLFLKNPKIRQPCAGSLSGATNRTQSTIQRKTLFKGIEISYTISFTATGNSMFQMYICRLQCAFARSRARCAPAARNHNTNPPETSTSSHSSWWGTHCRSVDKQLDFDMCWFHER